MNGVEHLMAQLAALGFTLTCSGSDLRVRGPAGALSPALRAELGARKAALIAHLQAVSESSPTMSFPELVRSPVQRTTAPLSFNQRRLWFLDRLEGGGSAFVIMAGWRLKGTLDRSALERALGALTARHELLRSVIRDEGVEPELHILPMTPFALTVETPAARSSHALAEQALLAREAAMPFDLTAAPPLRVSLLQLEPHRHVLSLAMHHIVSDHWSMGVLIRELGMLYALETGASSISPAALAIQYSDYAVWQRAMFNEERLQPHLHYWRQQLAGVVTELALPLDRPRPAERGNTGAMHQLRLARGSVQKVQAFGLRLGATPFMVLLAVYAQVLSRWSGQDEVVIGCPVGNRDRNETHGLVGFFVDTMPLRISLHGDPDLAELIRRIRTICLEAFEHQQAPFERIVQAVRPERALNKAPLFQTMFMQQSDVSAQLVLAGLQVAAVPPAAGAPELDLNFFVHLDGDDYLCVMEYDADLFDQASIAEFCNQYAYVLQQASVDASTPLSCIQLAPPSAPVLPAQAPAPLLPQMIADSMRRHADRIAVEEGAIRLTYRELGLRVALLAQDLADAGVQPGAVVGLGFSSSASLVVAMLAAWRVGAGYAVLSPQQPAARRAQMIAAAGIALVVTTKAEESGWPVPVLLSDLRASVSDSSFMAGCGSVGAGFVQRQALAYVCFTSGSSGTPKGVAVTHANLANHARAVAQDFGLRENDRVMQFAAADFDVAAEEIFPTLASGACVVIRAESVTDSIDAFQEHVEQAGLSVLNLPAAFWHEWVRALGQTRRAPPACLRLVVTGSDRVFARRWREWQALCAHPVAFRSGYGPTEATITSSFFNPADQPLPPAAGVLPVGRAIVNVVLEIVDGRGLAVPPGVIGEILISGAGVAQGYVGQPEQTAAAFRPHPLDSALRSYRSGDLGRRRLDGTLEFIGRKDQQAKVRGYRIELAEIEAAMMAHPKVREAAVLMRADSADTAGSGQLLAVAGGASELEPGLLRAWLGERLPAYMVPALCVILPRLPRTASGKTDRRALLELDITNEFASQHDASAVIATATAAEAPLAALFAQVLDRPAVGPCDNFFELGIDSIRSLQVVSRARQLQLNLTVRDIFRFQTVRELMHALQSRRQGMSGDMLSLPAADEDNEGEVQATPIQAWFFEQAGEHRAHYNQSIVLKTPAQVDPAALERALEAVVARHPMLRLQANGEILQIAASVPGPVLRVLDGASAELPARLAAYEQAQRGMDLRTGRVLQAVLVKPAGRLMIAVHHLAIDAYSWSVLLDDLSLAYPQALRGEVSLPAATASYRTWSRKLHALAATPVAQAAVDYFLTRFADQGLSVLPAHLPAGTAGAAEILPLSLDSETTTLLLQVAPGVFHARVDELLMAALFIGAARIGLKGSLLIDLERNGRVDLFEDLDLSDVVGWFTAVQPVLLQWPEGECDPAGIVMQVCERVRESPCQGLAMGVMRYLSTDAGQRAALQSLPAAKILLNYLGRLDIETRESIETVHSDGGNGFCALDEDSGQAQSESFARSHVIEINAGIRAGCLSGAVSFPAGAAERERIGAWLREVMAALRDIAAAAERRACSRQDSVEEELPLTPLQQGIVFHSLRDPDIYCNQLCLTLDGELDPGAMRRAWEQALQRHSMLRTSFHWRDLPAMRQRVHAGLALPWSAADWRGLEDTARAAALDELMRADVARGFTLEQAPLLRLQLLQVGDTRHELVWSSHHLLLDGWSVSVLLADIFALYRQALGDSRIRLKAAPRFSDYVHWQERRRGHNGSDGGARNDDIAFWQRALQGIEEPTSLAFAMRAGDAMPTRADKNAEKQAEIPAAVHTMELSAVRTQAVQKLAQRAHTTLGTVLQAAWGLLLARCSASRDVVFGVTVSGRPAELEGIEEMIGMLIATVPARLTIPSATPLTDWLAQLQEQHLEREQHAGASLTEIRQAASLPGNQELFQTLLLVQNYPKAQSMAGGGVRLADVQVRERTNYPLTLVCNPGASLRLALHRDGSIPAAAAERLLAQLGRLLDNMAAHPEWPAARLLALDDLDAQAALLAGRGPVEAIAPAFLPQQIDEWARHSPGAIALRDQEGSLSYAALRVESMRLARHLRTLGVGSEKKVALCLPRSSRYVIAVIGILRCGGAFVPLDPAYPAARRRFMLEDSGACLLIADGACARELQAEAITQDPDMLFAASDIVPVLSALNDIPDDLDFPPPEAQALAYVIYTSGSTGTPKGVGNTHGGLRSLAHAQRGTFGLLPDARVLQFASLSFDASIWEMTMAFGAGAALIVPDAATARVGDGLEQFMRHQRISAATLPPTALATMDQSRLPDLQTLVVAGESCAPELVLRWGPGRRFYNGYGPSEASVAVSVEAWSDSGPNSGQLLVGRPLPNMQLHVLDADMQLLPPGVIGELYIGGAGLARGYLNRPRLTAASFLPDPYGAPGARLYKTGDRGYRLADGRVQFVGRNDHQIKLRGFRIELSEIEAALMQHAEVRHAAVLVRHYGEGENDRRLTACLETRAPIANDVLRDFLAEQLPPHMLPACFIVLPSMPLTVNGKIDRKALEAMPETTAQPLEAAAGDYAGETERQLAGIWAQVLNVAQVQREHNFFELGGDSILAIQVVSKANRQGVALTLNQIMDPDSSTLAALAAQVDAAGRTLERQPASAQVSAPTSGPVPLTPIQHWFLHQDAPDRHHYNQSFLLEVPAGLDAQALRLALEAVCARHDALRLRFTQVDGVWHQHLSEHAATLLEVVPPPAETAGWRALLEQGAAHNQTRLNIEQGPLLRLVLYVAPAGEPMARLHVVAHHLVIDAVSWRVLLEDLFDAYAQAQTSSSIGLPSASGNGAHASFVLWAAAVERHAVSPQALGELRYWLEQPRHSARLPLLRTDIAATAGAAQTTSFALDESVTSVLVRELPRSHGAQVQEILLTALSVALDELIGGSAGSGSGIGIALESHGRDIMLEGIDVGGIPGWFTVLAPWTMPLGEHRIDKIREALKAMPRHGFSFGVLRFLSPDAAVRAMLAALPVPEIAFNYLGQWDTAWPDSLPVRPAPEADGAGFAPSTPRPYVLEVNALIAGGRLQLDLTFDPRVLPQAFADRLCAAMRDWLQALTRDVPAAAAAADVAVAACALAPQQAAMLAHAMAYPDSSAYVVQFTARLPAELDSGSFIAAWQAALVRHLSLRAHFTIGENGKARQHFGEAVPLAWQREDWTGLPDEDLGAAIDAYCLQERRRGFDLAKPPLMRFSLLQTATGQHFVWTYHHILIDGWSMPVLLSEVMAAYGKQLTAVPAPDFRVFLLWLERQDAAAARDFWRAELAAMTPSRWPAEQGVACSGRFAEMTWQPQAGTGARLGMFARRHRLSAPSIFMLAWALVLARHSRADEVCFGVTSVLRPAEVDGIETMVGNLINTPPLRCKIDPDTGFVEACLQLQRRRVATTAHAMLALPEIAQCAGLSDGDALFGTALRIQNYPLGEVGSGNAALQVSDVAICDYWHHPFNLEVTPGDHLNLIAVYDAGLVPQVKAEAMLRSYAMLLESLDESALGLLMEGMHG
ncbi:non-ribosomal peptide synthetase [Herbaspirillum autotrophicum]|uniref:non-ribosomal peptide synthetase n=1 Tax=Herbaspirillum autotrophicum TaxID=180195 RepID=UPI000AE6BE1F|nr:non-ribosomal peptide synthetase [Herbaspirillum autotrophicum]